MEKGACFPLKATACLALSWVSEARLLHWLSLEASGALGKSNLSPLPPPLLLQLAKKA
jgi:hypothetical protein